MHQVMAIKRTSKHDLDTVFLRAKQEFDRKTISYLSRLGKQVVQYAKEHGTYTDRTGNLRDSIGYVVVQYGKIVDEDFGSGKSIAKEKARNYAMEIARKLSGSRAYLVWVAGMDYARSVEAHGYDVLESSGNWMEANATTLKQEFKRYLANKG